MLIQAFLEDRASYLCKNPLMKFGIYFADHLLRNLNPLAVCLPNWWSLGDKEDGN